MTRLLVAATMVLLLCQLRRGQRPDLHSTGWCGWWAWADRRRGGEPWSRRIPTRWPSPWIQDRKTSATPMASSPAVTLCVPGTTTCQTFDHLLGRHGLGRRARARIGIDPGPCRRSHEREQLAAGRVHALRRRNRMGPGEDGGRVVGGESAANLPIQLIGEKTYTMPASCTGSAITDFKTLAANGILGVGVYLQDCGAACAQPASSRLNPGLYYACSSAQSCAIAAVPSPSRLRIPWPRFPSTTTAPSSSCPASPPAARPRCPAC
jgi:hypothetical protein